LEKARSLQKAKGWSPYLCLQQRHSFLRPRTGATFGQQLSTDEEILDYIRENPEIRLLAYSPLLGGSYSRDDREIPEQYRSFETERRLAALTDIAEETGATVNQVLYAWMLAGNPVAIPLIAPTTMAQMEENLGALEVTLSPDQMTRLDARTEYISR
jgi:aryl-alcohol dehydrogenase-like predicted oxidoreductase